MGLTEGLQPPAILSAAAPIPETPEACAACTAAASEALLCLCILSPSVLGTLKQGSRFQQRSGSEGASSEAAAAGLRLHGVPRFQVHMNLLMVGDMEDALIALHKHFPGCLYLMA